MDAREERDPEKEGLSGRRYHCCACWLSDRLGTPRDVTPESVARAVSPDFDVSEHLRDLTPVELTFLLLFESLRDRARYTNLDPPLNKAEQMFIATARRQLDRVTETLTLDIGQMESAWADSGLAAIYIDPREQ